MFKIDAKCYKSFFSLNKILMYYLKKNFEFQIVGQHLQFERLKKVSY